VLTANDARFIVDYAHQMGIKIIWFGYGNLSYELIKQIKRLDKTLCLICDTDSVWSRFLFRELPFIDDAKEQQRILAAVQRKEKEEKEWVGLCDITTAVSEVDAEYYRCLTTDHRKIAIFSNVLDVDKYEGKVDSPATLRNPSIYLAGSFGKSTSAMNRAAEWLINGIVPIIKRSIPSLHCYVVGNHSDISFGHLNSAHFTATGRVDSVLPYLKNIDVALTPLQFESGTRFKILEAAACKRPMVSTTLGAEGLPVYSGEHILLADKTDDFAQAVVRLIEDKPYAKQLAEASYQLIKQQFGIDRLVAEAQSILATIGVA
jgi:glycosyltransferase involved in cell wall biosynthesis